VALRRFSNFTTTFLGFNAAAMVWTLVGFLFAQDRAGSLIGAAASFLALTICGTCESHA
jgi:hypothetical protein